MVDLIPPSRWSAEPWRYSAMLGEDTSTLMDGWAVHWPGSRTSTFANPTMAETIARLLSWERFHTDPPPDGKGWRGLAYDYAIDLAGRAFRIRGTGQSGATSGDYDEDGVPNNRETDAVLLVLGASDVPSDDMLATFAALVDQLGGPRGYIIGHRQARGTVTPCPGDLAMRHVVTPAQHWRQFTDLHGDDMPTTDEIVKALLDEPIPHTDRVHGGDDAKITVRDTLSKTLANAASANRAAKGVDEDVGSLRTLVRAALEDAGAGATADQIVDKIVERLQQ